MNPMIPCPAGYFPGIPFDAYQRMPGLSKSALDWFRKSPAHYNDWLNDVIKDDETDAMRYGKLAHAAVLEKQSNFVISKFDSFRSKEAREWRDAQKLPVVTEAEADQLAMWTDAVWSNEAAYRLLKGTQCEVSMFADDSEWRIRLKGRADVVGLDYFADLKFVRDASPEEFSKAIYSFGYHRQAAIYTRIAKLLGQPQNKFFFIAVEKSDPPRVAVYELHENAIDLGTWEVREDIERLLVCRERNSWPGYVSDGAAMKLDVPLWAHTKFANRDLEGVTVYE